MTIILSTFEQIETFCSALAANMRPNGDLAIELDEVAREAGRENGIEEREAMDKMEDVNDGN